MVPTNPAQSVSVRWSALQALVRKHPIRSDAAVALFLACVSVASNQDSVESAKTVAADAVKTGANGASDVVRFGLIAALVSMLSSLPYALRRLAPFWSVVSAVGIPFLGWAVDIPDQGVSALAGWFAIHALAQYAQGRSLIWGRRLVVVVLSGVLVTVVVFVLTDGVNFSGSASRIRVLFLAIAVILGLFGTAWLSGWLGRGRNAHVALLAQRATELEERQDEQARQAVLDERVRIAREVHDVVAHHVSVMGVQAGAARLMLAKDPAKAGLAIGQIEASSRAAITDLSRLVMFLREANVANVDGTTDAPQPDLTQLSLLFEEARQSGMDLTIESSGQDHQVPASVGLCAYRIIQEALTNVRKHAGATATTTVKLTYLSSGLEIVVQNRGRIGSSGTGTGHGVLGMRERVALLGGTLQVGSVPGGFRVQAWLPSEGNASHRPTEAPSGVAEKASPSTASKAVIA
jgi:signal transduction histidine kinase